MAAGVGIAVEDDEVEARAMNTMSVSSSLPSSGGIAEDAFAALSSFL